MPNAEYEHRKSNAENRTPNTEGTVAVLGAANDSMIR
jgi:hypothetical protein